MSWKELGEATHAMGDEERGANCGTLLGSDRVETLLTSHPCVDMRERRSGSKALCHLFPVDLLFSKTIFGARVAHGDLLRALALYGQERKLLLALDSPGGYNRAILPGSAEGEIERLRGLGLEVSVLTLLELSRLLKSSDLVIIASGQESIRALAARNIDDAASPICTLCHSLVWPDFVASYLAAVQLSRSSDCFVVPSRAGKDAISFCFEFSMAAARHRPEVKAPEVRQIPYGIFPERFGHIAQQECQKLLEIPQGRFVLAYVGRLAERHKADLDLLLLTVKRLGNARLSVESSGT
ncbi:MAG: hypothetical protein ACRD4O_11845, partial [Bryobacteraceae bacterium]